jgi:SAM-dependent methyltransferase
MVGWSNGYVSDVEYLPGFYVEQTPPHIQIACVINGYQPPLDSRKFRYCELGCGQGTTALIIAAANPNAEIIAIDFNPAQIARARREAKVAQISNIKFLELSFDELLCSKDLTDFDIVSLHGVWSWISSENRRSIVSFLKTALKPGGAAAISYNSLPGWLNLLPFQKLLLENSNLINNRSDKRVLASFDLIEKMQQNGCDLLVNPKSFEGVTASKISRNPEDHAIYLAHEYLNDHWMPLYFSDTARILEDAKLQYVASASILDNFPDLMLAPEQKKIYDQYSQIHMKELIKDYYVKRAFRRDIYIKGAQKLSDHNRDSLLDNYHLCMTVGRKSAKLGMNAPAGEVKLPDDLYNLVFDRLWDGPTTIGALRSDLPENKVLSPVELSGILIGTGQAMPIVWSLDNSKSSLSRSLNIISARKVMAREVSMTSLAVDYSGSGLNINVIEAILFSFISEGMSKDDAKQKALKHLIDCEQPLLIEGVSTSDTSVIKKVFEESFHYFDLNTFKIWKNLQII